VKILFNNYGKQSFIEPITKRNYSHRGHRRHREKIKKIFSHPTSPFGLRRAGPPSLKLRRTGRGNEKSNIKNQSVFAEVMTDKKATTDKR
jgi:hypothetical protein